MGGENRTAAPSGYNPSSPLWLEAIVWRWGSGAAFPRLWRHWRPY